MLRTQSSINIFSKFYQLLRNISSVRHSPFFNSICFLLQKIPTVPSRSIQSGHKQRNKILTIKVPIFSHLCAFDTQNSLQTVHKQKKRCLHRRGSGCTQVLAQRKNGARHNACMRGKFLPAKKKKNPNACKDKRNHNACMRGEALASKEKEKDASEGAIYSLCCILHI